MILWFWEQCMKGFWEYRYDRELTLWVGMPRQMGQAASSCWVPLGGGEHAVVIDSLWVISIPCYFCTGHTKKLLCCILSCRRAVLLSTCRPFTSSYFQKTPCWPVLNFSSFWYSHPAAKKKKLAVYVAWQISLFSPVHLIKCSNHQTEEDGMTQVCCWRWVCPRSLWELSCGWYTELLGAAVNFCSKMALFLGSSAAVCWKYVLTSWLSGRM